MTSTVSELLRITKDILHYCVTEEPKIEEPQSLSFQRYFVKVVYNIILELAFDSLRMIEKRRYVSSATLLRSLFEYYIELLFLAKHPDNYKQRENDAKREQQKILNAIKDSKVPSLAKFKTDSKFDPRENELKNDLKDYHEKSMKSLCSEVECDGMYDSVYRRLSSIAHPGIIEYGNRYFKPDISGEMLKDHPAPQLDEEDTIARLVLLSEILVNSTRRIHHILPNCNTSVIDTQWEKFTRELDKAAPNTKGDH